MYPNELPIFYSNRTPLKHNHPNSNAPPLLGKVYLVGAGPGDPGLLTLRAVQCLQKADLVLTDQLVHPRILKYARPEAEIVYIFHPSQNSKTDIKHASCVYRQTSEVVSKMIEEAQKGRVIVRLKGGTPEIFGRLAQELAALRKAGVPYEIVPGITAGLAAGAYTEIPLTHSESSSAVALLTGHQKAEKQGLPLDYEALGQFPGTLVVYMGVATCAEWSAALIRGGMSPQTPAAIVQRGTWPVQKTIYCPLGNLPETIAQHQIEPPAVILVGPAVQFGPEQNWFEARPLFGQRILLTRPEDQSVEIVDQLGELGADVLVQPAIRIADPPDWRPVDEALDRLDGYDWLVFSSANGVRYFLSRLFHRRGDVRRLGRVKLAAIGPGTAAQLEQYHLRADLIPPEYRAESLAESLTPQTAGKRILLVRASRGREVLAEQLRSGGALVEQVAAYSSTDLSEPDPEIAQALRSGQIHWITVTSSSIARSLVKMFGPALQKAKLASISPITSETLRQLGYPPAVEARQYTLPGLVDTIVEAVRSGNA